MKVCLCLLLLAALGPVGCLRIVPVAKSQGSIEQLRAVWINRNGNIGSNVTVRVWHYKVETDPASFSFELNENDLRSPCGSLAHYRLPIERLVSSTITTESCPQNQAVWELVIDTSK